MRNLTAIMLAVATVGLAGCNASTLERAVVGAAVGCVAGEVLVDGRCVEGAVVGAGVGVIVD